MAFRPSTMWSALHCRLVRSEFWQWVDLGQWGVHGMMVPYLESRSSMYQKIYQAMIQFSKIGLPPSHRPFIDVCFQFKSSWTFSHWEKSWSWRVSHLFHLDFGKGSTLEVSWNVIHNLSEVDCYEWEKTIKSNGLGMFGVAICWCLWVEVLNSKDMKCIWNICDISDKWRVISLVLGLHWHILAGSCPGQSW